MLRKDVEARGEDIYQIIVVVLFMRTMETMTVPGTQS